MTGIVHRRRPSLSLKEILPGVLSLPYGCTVVGRRFDLLIILDPPTNDHDAEWLSHCVETRTNPGGLVLRSNEAGGTT